ncbi:hypothetical protein [Nostoc sp.]|uniref:hypothetical protein n=1 Tax=Nostoc sp. TaxID=1180 RepID=UPI002FFC11C0
MTDTATTTNLNKFEKFKAEKDGLAVRGEIEKFAALGWEAMDEIDRDHRLKWVGVFFRPVTPGKFIMRLRMSNGILTSSQMGVLAQVVHRQKSRLMWLIDQWGLEKFRAEVENRLGKSFLPAAAKDEIDWEKRDHIGVYKQKQAGLNYVGLHIPVGRLYAEDMFEIARIAQVYGSGEIRFTVEQNIVLPNISDSRLATFLTEPLLERFSIDPGLLMRSLVSCTGAQFCNFALIETKNRALAMIKALEEDLTFTKPVRIHWTGCPNSCGQPQVADIGLMGTKTRKNGKTLEAVDIYMGGKVGKNAHLGTCVINSIPCEDLQPVLQDLLIKSFGAKPR